MNKEADMVKETFMATLQRMNKGRTPFELDAALNELVAAVRKTGKPGKLRYTLTLAPAGKASQVKVTLSLSGSVAAT